MTENSSETVAAPMSLDESYLVVAALRYQLPRHTYGSSIVARAVAALWPRIHPGDQRIIREEIADALRDDRNRAGDACDRAEWTQLLATIDAFSLRRAYAKA